MSEYDDAMARLSGFFARHEPGTPYDWAACSDQELRDVVTTCSYAVVVEGAVIESTRRRAGLSECPWCLGSGVIWDAAEATERLCDECDASGVLATTTATRTPPDRAVMPAPEVR